MAKQRSTSSTLLDSAASMVKANPSLMRPDSLTMKKKKLRYPLPVGYRAPKMPQLNVKIPRP